MSMRTITTCGSNQQATRMSAISQLVACRQQSQAYGCYRISCHDFTSMQRVKVAHVVLPKRRCLFVLAKPQMQRVRHPCRSKGKQVCRLRHSVPVQMPVNARSGSRLWLGTVTARCCHLKALSIEKTSLQETPTCIMAESGCHRAAKATEAAGHHELQAPQRFQRRHGRLRLHACPQPEHDHPLVHLQRGLKAHASSATAACFRRGAHHMPDI